MERNRAPETEEMEFKSWMSFLRCMALTRKLVSLNLHSSGITPEWLGSTRNSKEHLANAQGMEVPNAECLL